MKRTILYLMLAALALLAGCTQDEELSAKPVIYLYPESDAKPVAYLYPEAEMEVTVSLDYDGELTCVYPATEN